MAAAYQLWLPIQARMVGCASASTYQGSIESPLWSASGPRVGRCEGPPHSYVRMPYGLLNAAATYQRLMRGIMEAQEARRSAALAEMEMVREEPPAPPEPPKAPGPGGS